MLRSVAELSLYYMCEIKVNKHFEATVLCVLQFNLNLKSHNNKINKEQVSACLHCTIMLFAWVIPMANCAAVQPSLSASRWSSLILASCLRPSSLFTRSLSHWYPFTSEQNGEKH